ncbi:hypothetical protein GWI33_019502 [Rhynchophorus ferrugineus]|uniref:Uncharacterized protein n=1 Tax=Rhynchophorus ferrugineus TaxID=354439 RepID=A0A834M590_RHYFE|nr:hypothetical protein GWI33_019502 [Rhynchophorus ferrugineus]
MYDAYVRHPQEPFSQTLEKPGQLTALESRVCSSGSAGGRWGETPPQGGVAASRCPSMPPPPQHHPTPCLFSAHEIIPFTLQSVVFARRSENLLAPRWSVPGFRGGPQGTPLRSVDVTRCRSNEIFSVGINVK